ncbi:T6SS effector amidase Tae4 family protein [Massilia sp. W12]|uniref:T6SS effector amidase Tae4 family protein n=1 Tax=Massilia sp. W12 TaxID=3126507 RepID=UPI0030CB179E
MKDLYSALGGAAEKNIHLPGFGPNGNTCASRLSVAFNKSGAPIDAGLASTVGALTLGTANGNRIIFRVADFRKYLLKCLGKPTIDNTRPFDDAFRKRKGIIAFSVNWQGASGHIALWNGHTYREPEHDNYSSYVSPSFPNIKTSLAEFWELK